MVQWQSDFLSTPVIVNPVIPGLPVHLCVECSTNYRIQGMDDKARKRKKKSIKRIRLRAYRRLELEAAVRSMTRLMSKFTVRVQEVGGSRQNERNRL